MSATLAPEILAAALLTGARMAGLVAAMPGVGGAGVPVPVRAALALALTAAAWPGPAGPAPAGLGTLILAAGGEVLLGAALGWTARLVADAAEAAGELIGMGMGLGLAASVDPLSGAPTTAVGQLERWLALTLFFTLDGHLALLAAAVQGARELPPGQGWFGPAAAAALARMAGRMTLLGLALAAPAVGALWLTQLALVAVGRSVPQLQLLTLAWPATIAAGLLLLGLGAGPAAARLAAELGALPAALGALGRALGRP